MRLLGSGGWFGGWIASGGNRCASLVPVAGSVAGLHQGVIGAPPWFRWLVRIFQPIQPGGASPEMHRAAVARFREIKFPG